MGTFVKWVVGIIVLTIAALLLELTPWGAGARSNDMGTSIRSALDAGGFKAVNVEMAGNVAKLTGIAPSEDAKQVAIDTAANAKCEKCAERSDPWHEVDASSLSVAKVVPTVRPYTLSGSLTDDRSVVLNGYAGSEGERDSILADAEALFPGKVIDNKIKIALGAPDANWRDVANANLKGLARLDSGQFGMENEQSSLTGRVGSAGQLTEINSLFSSMPDGYNGTVNVNAAGETAAPAPAPQIQSQDVCQALFDDLKGDQKINFAYGRGEIRDPASLELMKKLANAAGQCASFRLAVEGHTDADGSEAYNLELSRQRAEAVVARLVEFGVDPQNITGGGYGESRPIASNDTPQGMAANRRIEFKITRSR
jgi:outer membrane protein OmpA-like peptidoglycan-associated protein